MKVTQCRKSITIFCFLCAALSSRICLSAMLGVYTSDVAGGLVVTGVIPGTAADDSGLLSGDMILSVDGNAVNAEQFFNITKSKSVGDKIDVVIKRGSEEKTLSATLRERSPDPNAMYDEERKSFIPPGDMKPAPYNAMDLSEADDKRLAEAEASIKGEIESTPTDHKIELARLYFKKAKLYGPFDYRYRADLETTKSLLNEIGGDPQIEKEISAIENLQKSGPQKLKLYKNFSEFVFNGKMDGLKAPSQAAVSKNTLAVRDYEKKCVLLFNIKNRTPFKELADYDILDSMPDGFVLGTRWGYIKLITSDGEFKKSVRTNKYIVDIYTTAKGDIYVLGITGLVTRLSSDLEVVETIQLGSSGTNALNHPARVRIMGLAVWGGKFYVRFNKVAIFNSNGHLEKALADFKSGDMGGIDVWEDGRILAGTGDGVLVSTPDYEHMKLNRLGTSSPETAPDSFMSIDDMKIVEIDGKKLLLTADSNKGRVALFEIVE